MVVVERAAVAPRVVALKVAVHLARGAAKAMVVAGLVAQGIYLVVAALTHPQGVEVRRSNCVFC